MELTREIVEVRVASLRDTLRMDGYDLEVADVATGSVELRVVAGPEACADCLVPRSAMTAVLRQAILDGGDDDLTVVLRYPRD